MPDRTQILSVIAKKGNEATPIHRNKIAEELGERSYRSFQTQMDRYEKAGLIEGNEDHEYYITEAGLAELSGGSAVTEETDEEMLGTTEYQQFIHLGKITGVSPPELIKQTADHVWNGGEYKDLDWVARAFQEMGIRQDLRNRWWHSWRTYMHQPIPSQIPSAIVEGEKREDGKTEKSKSRDYILDEDDKPVYVGVGLGDMDFDSALDLAKIRAGRGKTASAAGLQQTPGSMADEVVKIFGAFQTVMGEKAQGKSWMVRQGEDGLQVEEVEPGRPMVISSPQGDNNPKPTFFVSPEGEVQEVQPGHPIIIKQPAAPVAPNGSGMHYLIDKSTGVVTQVQPGQPIVIQTQPQNSQYPYTPIQMKDKDGNDMILDISTFIRLEEHRDKQRREDESHETKQEIAKAFKDLVSKASNAVGHMVE